MNESSTFMEVFHFVYPWNTWNHSYCQSHFDCSGHLDDSESILKETLTVLS